MSTPIVPGYDPSAYPPFAVTADVVLFTIKEGALQVLLIQRAQEPFQGAWALPGGFVLADEDLDKAAWRELEEETGLTEKDCHLDQLATYGSPQRDPRMRVVTVAYWAVCAGLPKARAGSDAAAAEWIDVAGVKSGRIRLAFDHQQILNDARERLCAKLEYTPLGAKFLPLAFSVGDLRRVYEVVWSAKLDAGNFQRNFRASGAFKRHTEPPRTAQSGRGRPAALWSLQASGDLSATVLKRTIARRSGSGPKQGETGQGRPLHER